MPNKPQEPAIAGSCCIVVCVLTTLAQCHPVGLYGRVCARYARTRHADVWALAARFLPGGVYMRAVRPLCAVRPRGCRARASGRGRPLPPVPAPPACGSAWQPFPHLAVSPFLPRVAPCGSAPRLIYTLLLPVRLAGCGCCTAA